MSSTACPLCFRRLDSVRFGCLCTNSGCVQKLDHGEDPEATAHYGEPVNRRPFQILDHPWRDDNDWVCPNCETGKYVVDACPDCHYPMWERDWRQAGVTTIALTGAKSSGKSIYIAVLVQALEAYLLHSLHTSLKAVADADQGLSRLGTADRYTNYYQQRLFVERRKPDATPVGTDKWNWRVPLVFSLGQIHGMPRYLCIRDLPGEYIEQAMSATEWDFLGRADGVLFLFDSERTSDVQNKLGRHGDFTVTLAANLGLPPLDVLDSVLHMIGPSAPPLGLILAKLDYIWALRDVEMLGSLPAAISNLGASYIREPEQRENLTDQSHWAYPWADENGTYHPADPSDRDFLNEELRSLLTALGGGELLARLSGRKPSLEHRLFAVSALGEPIRGKSVSMRGITPYRVLDPVLWLLDRSWREA